MSKTRKTGLGILALLCALMLGFALAACDVADEEKDVGEPAYGYGEEGTYYTSVSEDEDYMLTLTRGALMLTADGGESVTGEYEYDGYVFSYSLDGDDASEGSVTGETVTLVYNGISYTFLRYEYYTVTFADGSSTITTQSVLNGKAAQDPGDATKEGYVFLGWYADSAFTERYEFNTSVTQDTTVYARFVEIEGITEYKITYDFGNGETLETETLNGRIYDLPEAEMTGYTFLGWWVSATNNADELTYKYDGETICEDTTLFAVYASGSYIGASIKDGTLTWLSAPASTVYVTVTDGEGNTLSYSAQSTSGTLTLPSLETGKYAVEVSCGDVTEILTYVSNGLYRVSGYTVLSGSILMYDEVPGADVYYVSVECGNPAHEHTMIDNGSSLYYDFSNCEMGPDGITFTVVAYADGYYYSVSSYNYFLGLGRAEVTVEDDTVYWDRVPDAQGYEIYVNGSFAAATDGTSFSLAGYGTGTYEIAVRPVTDGYYSELSEAISFTKTTLAAPEITGIENYVISWTEVEGATGYKISINGKETFVEAGITSLALSDDNYTEGLDLYEIAVKATAQDSNNDSPYGEAITVTGTSVGSAVSYSNGTVTWQYSLYATEYRITVNGGDETIVFGTNSSPVTLTKSGDNEIGIYFVDPDGEIYGYASVTVYAYAIVLDARGGTVVVDGRETEAVYVVKGDILDLPTPEYPNGEAEFMGWYTLPDIVIDPDKEDYDGYGTLYENGRAFTGSSTVVLYAFWVNERLTVSLVNGMGTLTDGDGATVDSTLIPINGSRYTIEVPEYDDAAYAFVGWYTGENGTGTRYTDETGAACATFSDGSVTTLYAYWAKILSFSTTTYDGETMLTVTKGSDIDSVSEVTLPETYTVSGKEYVMKHVNSTAFASCPNLEVLNIPDTIVYFNVTNDGYTSGSGALASSANVREVNVYPTGEEPSVTKDVLFYSEDGVLFYRNDTTGYVELYYYPYGRGEESYVMPSTVSNIYEYEYEGDTINTVPVVRDVQAVSAAAFRGHDELVSVAIADTVVEMGTGIFRYCSNLRYVELPENITKIDNYTFQDCYALEEIDIPYGVTAMGQYAFAGSGLRTVTLPDSVTELDTNVFDGCSYLVEAALSSKMTSIPNYAFRNCQSLTGITLPSGTTSVGNYAFQNCYMLTSIILPASLTSIGTSAFQNCYKLVEICNLSSIELTAGDTGSAHGYIEKYAKNIYTASEGETHLVTDSGYLFVYDDDGAYSLIAYLGLTSTLVLPDGIDGNAYEIYPYAFYSSVIIEDVTISDYATSIGEYAFFSSSVKVLSIGDGVTTIGANAFQGCAYLSDLTLGASVAEIGDNAFQGCVRLVEVANGSSLDIEAGSSEYGYVAYYAKNVYTPAQGSSGIFYVDDYTFIEDAGGDYYLVAYNGTAARLTLPTRINNKTYEINSYAFADNTTLRSVTLPNAVTRIGDYAFSGCTSLIEVNMGDGLTDIGAYAFYNCTGLTSITLGRNVESIGDYCFYCSGMDSALASIDYGESLKSIGAGAFLYDMSLTEVILPDSVEYVGDMAFGGCWMVMNIYLGENLRYVGSEAFEQTGYLWYGMGLTGSFEMGSNIEYIGDQAFAYCYAVTYLDLSSVTYIGSGAFSQCGFLTSVEIPEGVTELKASTFSECYNLSTVVLPGSLTSIGANCFQYCQSLTSITIPEGVTSIGNYAFAYCTSLTSIVIPSTAESIGSYAFNSDSRLSTVYYAGDETGWTALLEGVGGNGNSYFTGAIVYYYSAAQPAGDGNYWYWDADGKPAIW